MKRIYTVALLMMLTISSKANTKDSLNLKLETAIEKRNYYVELKLQKISRIKSTINITKLNTETFFKCNLLFNEYKSLNYDSAFKYSKKLIDIAYLLKDQEKIALAKTNISFILLSAGMFKETLDTIQSVIYNF